MNLICALTEWRVRFLFFLLTILGFYLVGVGAVDDPLLSRGEHCSPVKNHKVTFLLWYFSVKKSTKSQQGGLAPSSFRTTGGVHELVAGSSAWQVRAAKDKSKVGGFALSAI